MNSTKLSPTKSHSFGEDHKGQRDGVDASTDKPSVEYDEPPNGGFQAWLQVLNSFILFVNTWGLVNMFGVFQTYYELSSGWPQSSSDISWIGSLQAALLFFGGFLAGPVFDMGYLRVLLIAGTFLVPFGLMMTSVCHDYWQALLAQGLCIGLGFGCLFLPSITIVAEYFTTRKSIAFGMAAVGSAVGAIIYQVIFRQLQPRAGFGWAVRTIGFIVFATMLIPLFSMRQRRKPQGSSSPFTLAVLRHAPFTIYCVGLFFAFTAVYITFFYIQLYALERTNMNSELASYLLAISIGSSVLGRLGPGYLADKLGPLNVQVPLAFVCALLCFCWIAISTQAGLIAFAVFYGIFSGGFNSLPGMTVVSLSRDMRTIGIQLGISLTVAGLGVLIGEPIAGAIVRTSGGWLGLQLFCAVLFVIAGVFMATARLVKTGLRFAAKS